MEFSSNHLLQNINHMLFLSHYFHLLYFLDTIDVKILFNAHLHQIIINNFLTENDLLLLIKSPLFDINYVYNHNLYEEKLQKCVKNNIYLKNIHIRNVRKRNSLLHKISDLKIKLKKRKYNSSSSSSSSSSENEVNLQNILENNILESENESEDNNINFNQSENDSSENDSSENDSSENDSNDSSENDSNDSSENESSISTLSNNSSKNRVKKRKINKRLKSINKILDELNNNIKNYYFVGNINEDNTYDEELLNKHLYKYFSSFKIIDYKKYEDNNILLLACMKKLDKLTYYLLTYYNIQNINHNNKNNETPLLLCCENNMIESSKYLLSHKDIQINLYNKYNEHLLVICCKNNLTNQALQILFHDDFKKFMEKNNSYIIEDALSNASKNNMHEVVINILQNYKLDIDYVNKHKFNSLYWCAYHNIKYALHKLLKYKNIDITYSNKHNIKIMEIFEKVCSHKSQNIALKMLKNKNFIFNNNIDGNSPFYYACEYNLPKVALKILEKTNYNIDFNSNAHDRSSLLYACKENMNNIVSIILNSPNICAKYVNITDSDHNSALNICCKNKNIENAFKIINLKKRLNEINLSQINRNYKCALYYAIKYNLTEVIDNLIEENISYSPLIPKMFNMLSSTKYTILINKYKNNNHVCNICYECNENNNYIVKCEKCVGIFHIQCLKKYFDASWEHKCPYCREKCNYFLV